MPSPEQPADTEPSSSNYYQAARFSRERDAGRAYFKAQAVIFESDCDISAYRLQLNRMWHVAILGARPAEDLDATLRSTLSTGAATALPDELLDLLWQRRSQAVKRGPWIERHFRPGQPT